MDSEPSRRTFIASGVGAVASAAKPSLAAPQDLPALRLRQASQMLRRKTVSPVELPLRRCRPDAHVWPRK
jgi:hypothetical protein